MTVMDDTMNKVIEAFGVTPAAVFECPETDNFHQHIAIKWRGGVLWLDMFKLEDHFCIDIRQFNPDAEMKGQGVFTIVNGRRQSLGEAHEPMGSGKTVNKVYKNSPLEDTEGTPVTAHKYNGGYVITLITDLHGEEAAAIKPSQGNG